MDLRIIQSRTQKFLRTSTKINIFLWGCILGMYLFEIPIPVWFWLIAIIA